MPALPRGQPPHPLPSLLQAVCAFTRRHYALKMAQPLMQLTVGAVPAFVNRHVENAAVTT